MIGIPYNLPARQKETLEVIIAHIKAHGQSPTFKEIAKGMKPPSTVPNVKRFCEQLEEKGHISREPFKHNSIELIDKELLKGDAP